MATGALSAAAANGDKEALAALDQLAPTQLAIPASFKIPENLTCVEYPKHMEERYIKRLSRQQKLGQAAQPKAGGKGKGKAKGSPRTKKTRPSGP